MFHFTIAGTSYHEVLRAGNKSHIRHCNCDDEEDDDIP